MPGTERRIFFTFDDGPIPEVTPWVLEQLKTYNAKATFFCIGDNVEKHSGIYDDVIAAGHSIGNHTFHHLNGWQTSVKNYVEDVNKCSEIVNSNLFRPPYGKITRSQIRTLIPHYKIIMWDILSRDFDKTLNVDKGFEYIKKHIKPGSVIVFHDSLKAWPRLKELLPRTLEFCKNEGYIFDKIV
jgi:peptidoglycan-N-acetylglucosamine deacetylase